MPPLDRLGLEPLAGHQGPDLWLHGHRVHHHLVQIWATPWPTAPLQPGKPPSLQGLELAAGQLQENLSPPVPSSHPSAPSSLSHPHAPRSCRGTAMGACRECSLQPCASGVFMLCVPVRFEMSYWTSLGNFNILKRKIKKKEKQKKKPQPLLSPDRASRALCMAVPVVLLSLLLLCL